MKTPPAKNIAWDSPRAAGRFILGAFLLVGLFPWVRYGAEQLLFLAQAGVNPPLIKIDLRDATTVIPKAGWVEITGYAGDAITRDTAPTLHDFRTVKNFYYPLSETPRQTAIDILIPIKEILVQHTQSKVGRFWFYPSGNEVSDIPKPNRLVTIRGVIGPPIGNIPKTIRDDFDPPFSPNAPLLAAGATSPALAFVVSWLLPSLIGFTFGLYLAVHWLVLLRTQFFKNT